MNWVKFKSEAQLNKKTSSGKHSRLKGIPKLDDANDAGTKNSRNCTLIVTEGDSAKALAMAGLSVVGRDKYGVFPLRGKLLNVRDASHKQVILKAISSDYHVHVNRVSTRSAKVREFIRGSGKVRE